MSRRITKAERTKNGIEKILKGIVITRKEGARGNALETLLKMRYGHEWRSAT